MRKSDLIDKVADEADLSHSEAEAAVAACFDTITQSLSRQDPVRLVGFGTFKISHRKARMGTNPQTREPLHIRASNAVVFKPGTKLKAVVA